ncbi:MAG: type II toxin-antitoxin system VapC family toxin [Actinomycetota bacterium]|nr:type II toxin-antitoxin system VapC family toxin [Actinomycetota bacterium]
MSGCLSASAGTAAILDLGQVPIARSPHAALLDGAWEHRDNLSFYDALYVALAEQLEVSLFTFDQRVARAPGLRCDVETL